MGFFRIDAGLRPDFPSPPAMPGVATIVTEEAAVEAPTGRQVRVTPLVEENDVVAKGAAVACLKHAPDISFVAPFAGRVARIALQPGGRLSEIVLFREPGVEVERHDPKAGETPAGLRRLMQHAGLWPRLRRRPFGGMPAHDEAPAAIVVMAADTTPLAPDPFEALIGREAEFARGARALERLTDGPVFVVRGADAPAAVCDDIGGGVRVVTCGRRHPQGAAGIRIHQLAPAGLDAPVWDIAAEDVAALGTLLETGALPMRRLVRISGGALRQSRTVRTHPGADLRELIRRIVAPGPHVVLSGSPLDGRPARWLAPRHRQVTVLPRPPEPRPSHWLVAALTRSAAAKPAIATEALNQAFGAALPALPFIRALGAGDDETAMRLGLLSLLEEDIALADYVLGGAGELRAQLRAMLDRIETEFAA